MRINEPELLGSSVSKMHESVCCATDSMNWCRRDDTALDRSPDPPGRKLMFAFFLVVVVKEQPVVQIDPFSRLIVTDVAAFPVRGDLYQEYY